MKLGVRGHLPPTMRCAQAVEGGSAPAGVPPGQPRRAGRPTPRETSPRPTRSRGAPWRRTIAVVGAVLLPACAPGAGSSAAEDDARAGAPEPGSPAVPDTLEPPREGPGALATVRPGAAVLLTDSLHLVRGRRVGLVTNHTGILPAPGAGPGAADTVRSVVDVLFEHPDVELVALYSPEHGLTGLEEAGVRIASGRHEGTGLPVYSLYGADRKPRPEMLEGVDVLLFDIQDVGARYYTYVYTMALAMEAAGEAGVPFVVLDRPVPIGGVHVHGNVLDPAFASFVGLYPLPMRHGMTPGELARLYRGEFGVQADLRVVPLEGWTRATWFDETGLPWVAPSPNMPSLESAAHYPGSCLFEGTNLSVGRGTDAAFQQVGAPWLDGEALAQALAAQGLLGVRFEPVVFTPRSPGDGKYGDETVRGVRFVVTDRTVYDPARAGVAAVVEARRLAGDRWRWNEAHFDRLAGTDRLRLGIEAGAGVETLTAGWPAERRAFEALRERYLLYR